MKRELNSYDTQIIKSIEDQYKAVYDGAGKLITPESNVAKVTYGTLSLTAEEHLVKKGYTVINSMPLATITKPNK